MKHDQDIIEYRYWWEYQQNVSLSNFWNCLQFLLTMCSIHLQFVKFEPCITISASIFISSMDQFRNCIIFFFIQFKTKNWVVQTEGDEQNTCFFTGIHHRTWTKIWIPRNPRTYQPTPFYLAWNWNHVIFLCLAAVEYPIMILQKHLILKYSHYFQ